MRIQILMKRYLVYYNEKNLATGFEKLLSVLDTENRDLMALSKGVRTGIDPISINVLIPWVVKSGAQK